MIEWADIVSTGLVALASFAGSLAAVRTDIRWIRERVKANEKAASHTADRLDRHIESHR